MYDYDKQTEEELSFNENDVFNVYDLSDPDWILVSNASKQEFGFVPSNYIQLGPDSGGALSQIPQQIPQPEVSQFQPPPQPHVQSNAMSQPHVAIPNFAPPPTHPDRSVTPDLPPPTPEKDLPRPFPSRDSSQNRSREYNVHGSDEEDAPPPMPSRPTGPASDAVAGSSSNYEEEHEVHTPTDKEHKFDGEFFTWYIDELDGRKKRPIKVSVGQGLLIIKPNVFNPKKLRLRSASHINNQWQIKDLISVNSEKKHVFLELKNPPAELELHAGTKEVAYAITSILGELKGAERAAGLREVQKASQPSSGSSNKKIGRLTYDFRAQSEDELNCREGDEVYIINQSKSSDWWMVENINTGRQGVVPSSYIEVIGNSKLDELTDGPVRRKSMSSSKGKVVSRKDSRHHQRSRDERERIRERDRAQREKQSSKYEEDDKSMPNFHRVRTWIDSSGTFKVEAEFLGFVDGKVHLHKTNGVKIAVAAEKLSIEDLEYVEKITESSLDKYKQIVFKQMEKRARSKSKSGAVASQPEPKRSQSATAAIHDTAPPQPSRPRPSGQDPNGAPAYDWFDFFLECGVDVGNCQRYTLNFEREQMDENILEDISPSLLRTLGLREGDIIRVMKHLDNKYNRKRSTEPEQQQSTGSLFIDSNGALKNNSSTELSKVTRDALPSPVKNQPSHLSVPPTQPDQSGKIDDDAWAMKPAARSNENLLKPSPQPQTPQYTGSLSDLVNIKPVETKPEAPNPQQTPSAPPLQPTKTSSVPPLQPTKTATPTPNSGGGGGGVLVPAQRTGGLVPVQRTGAGLTAMPTGGLLPAQPTGFIPITAQPTGFIPIQATGILQPQLTLSLVAVPTGQRTGGAGPPQTTFGQPQSFQPGFVPLQTGTSTVPQTSFGTQNTGGLPSTTFGAQNTGGLPSTTFGAQNTGGLPATSFNLNPLVPAQRTGGLITGGFVPQSNFGKQITGGFMNTNTVPIGQQQPTGGMMPQTSFGQQATGGMMPQTSFGQQATGGMMPQTSFGNPMPQSAFNQPNGGNLQNSFGQPQQNTFQQQQPFSQFPQQPTQFNQFGQQPQQQQPQPNMNQMTNMFQNTSISQPFNQQGGFGNSQFEGFNSQPLQTQPTGMGFGNSPLQTQATGKRANLAAATPDNPFGF